MSITINGREATKREMDIIERALGTYRETVRDAYAIVQDEQPNFSDIPAIVTNHGVAFVDEIMGLENEVNDARREYVDRSALAGSV